MKTKTDIFIEKAIALHGEQYEYSKSEFKTVDSKLEIVCKNSEHGTFFQTPYKHLNRKQGCPICGIEKSKNKTNVVTESETKKKDIKSVKKRSIKRWIMNIQII